MFMVNDYKICTNFQEKFFVQIFQNLKNGLLECRIIRHPDNPVPDWNNLTMSELVRYRIKAVQSGIFLPGTGLRRRMPECRCRR
jgi:hypothetical protein